MSKKEIVKKIFSFLTILIGIGLLAYPWISNYVNQHKADNVVDAYQSSVENSDEEIKETLLKEANKYNETLLHNQVQLTEPFEESMINTYPYIYEEMLSVDGSDVMGSIKIPKINVNLPIYHGTSTEVLEKGVGHLKGSSLPVGGKNTHSVLTGHTGLANAKLFTDLVELKKEDIFVVEVLGKKMAYKVVDIFVVKPEETDLLKVIEGKDLCTLVTCTPYGVNTHRLLVRGQRTKYVEEAMNDKKFNPADSLWMRSYLKAILIGLAITLLLILLIILWRRRKKKKEEEKAAAVEARPGTAQKDNAQSPPEEKDKTQ